jgi:hypothetical protein
MWETRHVERAGPFQAVGVCHGRLLQWRISFVLHPLSTGPALRFCSQDLTAPALDQPHAAIVGLWRRSGPESTEPKMTAVLDVGCVPFPFSLKRLPARLQQSPELANTRRAQTKLSGHFARSLPDRQGGGNPTVTVGHRTKPGRHIDPCSRNIRRRGATVLNQYSAPFPLLIIQTLDEDSPRRARERRSHVMDPGTRTHPPTGNRLADCKIGKRRGVGSLRLATLDKPHESAKRTGDRFRNQILPTLGIKPAEGPARLAANLGKHFEKLFLMVSANNRRPLRLRWSNHEKILLDCGPTRRGRSCLLKNKTARGTVPGR